MQRLWTGVDLCRNYSKYGPNSQRLIIRVPARVQMSPSPSALKGILVPHVVLERLEEKEESVGLCRGFQKMALSPQMLEDLVRREGGQGLTAEQGRSKWRSLRTGVTSWRGRRCFFYGKTRGFGFDLLVPSVLGLYSGPRRSLREQLLFGVSGRNSVQCAVIFTDEHTVYVIMDACSNVWASGELAYSDIDRRYKL